MNIFVTNVLDTPFKTGKKNRYVLQKHGYDS